MKHRWLTDVVYKTYRFSRLVQPFVNRKKSRLSNKKGWPQKASLSDRLSLLRIVMCGSAPWLSPYCASSVAQNYPSIIVQSTTSTENSGFYKYILPPFQKKTGIHVKIVSVGTGQAIKNTKNCDGDVLLVHSPTEEKKFVENGFGVKRTNLMYNHYVIVGPKHDPAQIVSLNNAIDAFEIIAEKKMPFASRGDSSGTYQMEMNLWKQTSVNPKQHSTAWYRELGAGMGATLNIAGEMNAYTLVDRATWIHFKNKANLRILVEDPLRLANQYGLILVNPITCPYANTQAGQVFIDWLVSPAGQSKIADYKINGQQLFFPNAP